MQVVGIYSLQTSAQLSIAHLGSIETRYYCKQLIAFPVKAVCHNSITKFPHVLKPLELLE